MQATRFADAQTAYPEGEGGIPPGHMFPSIDVDVSRGMGLDVLCASGFGFFNLWLDTTKIQNRFVLIYYRDDFRQRAIVGRCDESIKAYGERTAKLFLGHVREEAVEENRDELVNSNRPWPQARFFPAGSLEQLEPDILAQVEACMREIESRARRAGLDYQSEDIKVFRYPCWGTVIFLTRCNPARAVEWIQGIPVPVLSVSGDPVIEYTYPLHIETSLKPNHMFPVAGSFAVAVGVRLQVYMPAFVFVVLEDGTVKDGTNGEMIINHMVSESHLRRVEADMKHIAENLNCSFVPTIERMDHDVDPDV